ncbi:MAG TPA: tetratricopeptide repeat protein, partial [Myxococcota bacterium]|nr:tetratricopeptide repeat protein [Myxococcota bacterium]
MWSRVVFDTTSDSRRLVTVEDGAEQPSESRYATLLWDIAPNGGRYPDWVRPLTEALCGKLLNRERLLNPVPFDRLATLSEVRQTLASAAEDDWTVWGRWLLAPPDTRTVSPFSKTTIPEEAARRIDQNTLASLREVTRRQPTNSVAFARLALLEQKTPPVPNPQALRDAEFHGRWALRCNPRESLAWQFLGSFQGMQGLATKAIEAIDRALELDPNNQGAWLEKGYILENLGRPQEALAAYEHRLTLLPRTDQKLARDRKTTLL